MTTPITVVDDARAVALTGAARIAEAVSSAVAARGVCFLALAGGETPRGCYEVLARPPFSDELPWAQVVFFWSDERCVPLTDPASNYRLAKETLLDRVPVTPDSVVPAPVDAGTPEVVAERYARALDRVPGGPDGWPRFDLILLGLGEDGHTASLFPGDPVLEERSARVRAVRASKPPPDRITFTLPVLNAARSIVFLVQGAGKREALARVRSGDRSAPAALIRPTEGRVEVIADRSAAG